MLSLERMTVRSVSRPITVKTCTLEQSGTEEHIKVVLYIK